MTCALHSCAGRLMSPHVTLADECPDRQSDRHIERRTNRHTELPKREDCPSVAACCHSLCPRQDKRSAGVHLSFSVLYVRVCLLQYLVNCLALGVCINACLRLFECLPLMPSMFVFVAGNAL